MSMKRLALVLLLLASLASARGWYVSTTGVNGAAGTLVAPLASIQAGVDSMNRGDTLYLRGGTYVADSIDLSDMIGTADSPYVMTSYSNEWAKIDGQHQGGWYIIGGRDDHVVAYWKFEWFEVCGAGPELEDMTGGAVGCGFLFYPGHNMTFDHMYIHDNYGGGVNNGGNGVKFSNSSHSAHNVTVSNSYFHNNGWPGNSVAGTAHIRFFADYVNDYASVNQQTCRSRNQVYNCLLTGASGEGVSHKRFQLMADSTGNDTTWKYYGSRFHHNIIRGASVAGILSRDDFTRIDHNVIDSSREGIRLGDASSDGREPFHVVVHNNRITGIAESGIGIWNGGDSPTGNYAGQTRARLWILRNVVRGVTDPTGVNNYFRIFTAYAETFRVVDRTRLNVDSNYFSPASMSSDYFSVGLMGNRLTLQVAQDSGYQSNAIADNLERPYIHSSNPEIPHPYLPGVTLPSYIGPDTGWVAGVEDLVNLPTLALTRDDAAEDGGGGRCLCTLFLRR